MAADIIKGLRTIEVEGDPHGVGIRLGQKFGDQIERMFEDYALFKEVLVPFRETNTDLFRHIEESQRSLYPRSFRMLEGIAEGVGHNLPDLLLYNTRGEIRALVTKVDGDKNPVLAKGTPVFDVERVGKLGRGCCDLVCGHLLGHNEDGDPAELQSSAYVNLIVDGKKVNAVVYAGALVGNAATFLYNDNEVMSITVEDIWGVGAGPLKQGVNYGGRQFAASEIIWANNLGEVVKALIPVDRLAGFYYTASAFSKYTDSTSYGKVIGVEVGPFSHKIVDIGISGESYVHTNRYKHITDPEFAHPSSVPREKRFNHLLAEGVPEKEEHVVKMMFDRGNKKNMGRYQICRTNPKAEGKLGLHHLWTMVTDLVDLKTNIYMLRQDKQGPELVGSINHSRYL